MGERVVCDQAAGCGEGPPVAQVFLGGLLDEEGRDRHVGPAHDGQYLRARGPAVVDGDVDGAPGGTGETVQPVHGGPAGLGQGRDRDRDERLLAVLCGQLQPGPAGGPAVGQRHLRRCREANLEFASARRGTRPAVRGSTAPSSRQVRIIQEPADNNLCRVGCRAALTHRLLTAAPGSYSSMRDPTIRVLSRGSWKYSAASAVIREVAMNSRLRQRLMPGCVPRTISMRDRK